MHLTIKGRDANNSHFLEQYDIEAPTDAIFCGLLRRSLPGLRPRAHRDFSYFRHTKADIYFDKERMLANWDNFAAKGALMFTEQVLEAQRSGFLEDAEGKEGASRAYTP